MSILELNNLSITLDEKKLVDNISIHLNPGEIVGLVGESGCGKSLTALSIIGIHLPGAKTTGEILYKNNNLLNLDFESMRKIRGNKISLIPQDPLSALNPLITIGEQISETLEAHQNIPKPKAKELTVQALRTVNIPDPNEKINFYPHQFSGGMKQRVLIAMGLINEPDILIADEPTTALDVTVQLQILEIIKSLKNKNKGILLITHDLGVVSEICDRVYVMYLGRIVESAKKEDLFFNPRHPYTVGLLNSLPDLNKERLNPIPGQPPSIDKISSGCAFHPRCSEVFDKCKKEAPDLYSTKKENHFSRCFLEKN